MKPPASFRIAASAMRLWHPWPTQVGDLDADNVVRCLYCDRDRLAGGTRAAVEDTVDEKLVREQCCHVPAPVSRAEHPVHECAGDPRTLRPPRKRHGLPDRPSHRRNRPSPPAPTWGSVRAAGRAHTGMHARLGGARQAGHAARVARPWPSAETPTVHTDRHNCAHRPS
jgi:hypothetical protein